jgi:hypothetical protein
MIVATLPPKSHFDTMGCSNESIGERQGRLLRPPRLMTADMPLVNLSTSPIQQGNCAIEMVLSSAWANDRGTAIWVAVNHGKVAVNITARLRTDDAKIEVRHHEIATASGWRRFRPGWTEVELSQRVPALSGVVVEI